MWVTQPFIFGIENHFYKTFGMTRSWFYHWRLMELTHFSLHTLPFACFFGKSHAGNFGWAIGAAPVHCHSPAPRAGFCIYLFCVQWFLCKWWSLCWLRVPTSPLNAVADGVNGIYISLIIFIYQHFPLYRFYAHVSKPIFSMLAEPLLRSTDIGFT